MSACAPAGARVIVAYRLASPPLPVDAGQQFSLCAANVGAAKLDLQLQFMSVRTGAVVANRELTLPPPGAPGMPDPCLSTTAAVVVGAGAPPPGEQALVVAIVVIKRSVFGRQTAATAAVQVTVEDPSGVRRLVASVPLHLATLINGRNTPIELVH